MTLATANPMDAGFTSSIRVVGREDEAANWPEPSVRTVSTTYLETLRIPLRAAGPLAADHAESAPVVVINESAEALLRWT